MLLPRSKATASMLAATATALALLLIGATEAAGTTNAQNVPAADLARAAGQPKARHRFETANQANTVRRVRPAKTTDPARHAKSTDPARHAKTTTRHARNARHHAASTVKSTSWRLVFPRARKAGAASDPADTISDFKFTPGTLTIHVGDTVTWTNNGPTEHTATADNGSFNTGTLKKGQSASHTFTKAGTFAYICAIHPFMKGTIVVEASAASTTSPSTTSPSTTSSSTTPSGATGSGSGTGGSTSATSGSSSGTAGSGPILPATGLDLAASVLLGLTLLGAGLVLRRRVS